MPLVFISLILFFFWVGVGGKRAKCHLTSQVWGDMGEGGGSNPLGCVMCEYLPNKKKSFFHFGWTQLDCRVVGYDFCSFWVQWVMPRGVVDLLACWQGCLKPHRNSEVWKGYPLLLLIWCVWRERNEQSFEGCEWPSLDLKQQFLNLRTMFEWMTATARFSFSNLLYCLSL